MRPIASALVTGATGFIGSALVSRLRACSVEVTYLIRSRQRAVNALAEFPDLQVIEVPSFQTSQLEAKLANISAEVVFHLASYGVQQEDRDFDQLIEGNVALVAHLLEATTHWPLRRFIHTGSCSEYGSPESEGTPISENQRLRPTSSYGAAKAATFLLGNALASRLRIPFVTLRLFGVFGTREAPQRLVPYLIHRLRRDEPVDLTPGEQVRDFLYEEDVAEAFLEAASSDRIKPYEVYNVCSGRPTRILDLGEAVADALKKSRQLLHWGERVYRDDEAMWQVGDNRRFVGATSWVPRISVEEGIRRMIVGAHDVRKKSEGEDAV
jgi:nucleoside-diphosphate-sugar epimerase